MALNPIGEKLAKMFGKKQKQKLSASTAEGTIIFTPSMSLTTEEDYFCESKEHEEIEMLKKMLKEEQNTTNKLNSQVKHHEMLEEFYLKELKSRK